MLICDVVFLSIERSEEVSIQKLLTGVNDSRRERKDNEGNDKKDVEVSFLQPRDFIARFDDNFPALAAQHFLVVGVKANSFLIVFRELDLKIRAMCAMFDCVEFLPQVARGIIFNQKVFWLLRN